VVGFAVLAVSFLAATLGHDCSSLQDLTVYQSLTGSAVPETDYTTGLVFTDALGPR
jgi:hypothetical protein